MKKEDKKIIVCQVMGEWFGGGVESVIMNYYRQIDCTKFQFDFICLENSTHIPYEEIEKLGGRVFLVPHYKHLSNYVQALRKLFRENQYRIVHANLNALSVLPLYAAKKENIPIRIAHSHSTSSPKEPMRNVVKNVLRMFSKTNANQYFACSSHAAEWLFGKKTVKEGKVFILNNAIDYEKFYYQEEKRKLHRAELKIADDTILYGVVGRLVTQKNPFFILDLLKELHQKQKCQLVFVGQGPLQEKIIEKAKEYHLENDIFFVGQRTDVNEWYSAMDMLLFPSLYEGFGMVAVEAQVAGLPVVCSTEVPIETKISEEVFYINLQDNMANWCDKIMELYQKNKNNDRKNIIVNRTYDIQQEAHQLEEKYKSYIL